MSIGVLVWMNEIFIGILALVALGVLLVGVRASTSATPGQSLGGRIASLLAAVGIVMFWWPRWSSYWFGSFSARPDWQYAIPTAVAAIAIVVFVLTDLRRVSRRPLGEIDLAPRSLWSFGSRSWFVGWWALNLLVVCTVLLAGSASAPDDEGRYTTLEIQLGSGTAATTFFGWAYGTPVLIALGSLVLVVHLALWRIARPAAPADPVLRDRDRANRRNQARTVLAIASGAAAFTLGQSWLFIGRSAQLAGSVYGPDRVPIEAGTPFAALTLPLTILGYLLAGLGLALVLLGLFQPRRHRVRISDPRAAETSPAESVH